MFAKSSAVRSVNHRTAAAAAAAATALILAGCGSGSPSSTGSAPAGEGQGSGDLDQVSVGLIPITDVAPVYLGIQEGYFEDEGIDLQVQLAQGGAAIVPAVMTGEYQFGYSNAVSLLIAQDKGLPISVVSNGSSSTNEPGKDTTEVAAMPDSGIQDAADLEGKTVAVNALNNFADVTIRNSMEQAGADPQKVDFVEMPYPNMPAALDRGDVDAAWTTEPFRTQILEAGGEIVASPMTDMAENFDSAFYFTSEQTLQQDPELVERFQRALAKSFEFAVNNDDEVRTIIQDYAKITPELAETVEMSKWYPEVNMDALQKLGAAAKKYGVIEKDPDYDALIAD
ncbi:putative ABC transporter substrate-binding protein [Arthrobacter crystallopoietes BAB-32]|uniref:Putative ABC transporter substrate-binding protein n=1 Tax=Arthrobacter crystallopoietes BAB-32 TaxID=1246476 RepID=N1UY71_9MICC|nr:ABC transporter substrate-binding protein [Arthrobacter crystallopoietes]EMY32729.1 putative ABC transporter substrate-binding protein [Arthrobacter crystallopoietes BAB-32]